MNKIPAITVTFQGSETVTFKSVSLKDIAQKLLTQQTFINLNPLLVKFSTGKQLYFDENIFQCFMNEEIGSLELMELTLCDGLYRNTSALLTDDDQTVDAGELWKCTGNKLTLIDADNHITSQLDLGVFQMLE